MLLPIPSLENSGPKTNLKSAGRSGPRFNSKSMRMLPPGVSRASVADGVTTRVDEFVTATVCNLTLHGPW